METIEGVAFTRYVSDKLKPKHKRMDAANYIDWANFGAREAQRWISIDEEIPPEDGQDILLKSHRWIDEDYNVNGVRIGTYAEGVWTSAYWCRQHDEYHTRTNQEDDSTFDDSSAENQIPTHWRPIERTQNSRINKQQSIKMEVKNLRLGNFIEHNGDFFTVLSIHDDGWLQLDNSQLNTHISECKELELTEDWVKKLGFDDSDYREGYTGIDSMSTTGMTTDFVITKPKFMGEWQTYYAFDLPSHRFSTINYVHELQNLFNIITGHELEIKEQQHWWLTATAKRIERQRSCELAGVIASAI